jgi:hypothetical protein
MSIFYVGMKVRPKPRSGGPKDRVYTISKIDPPLSNDSNSLGGNTEILYFEETGLSSGWFSRRFEIIPGQKYYGPMAEPDFTPEEISQAQDLIDQING